MSAKAAPELDPLDLVVRARRTTLSAGEREALANACVTSATVRVAYDVGSALDRAVRVRPGDEALLERALEGALGSERPIRRRRLPRVAVALAATLGVASAAAAASEVFEWQSQASVVESNPVGAVEQPASNRTPRRTPPVSTTSPEPGEAAVPPAPVAPPMEVTTRAPTAAPAGGFAPPSFRTTAASLFGEAGTARRAGDLARARALYAELVGRFPDSTEARVSRVSLGKLLLGAGNAREADAAFAAYLRSGATGLREEALVGRADALRALGRRAEERSVWNELVRAYPASVYANRALERIAELDGALGR